MPEEKNYHKPLNLSKETIKRLAQASEEDGGCCAGSFQPVESWEDVIDNRLRRARIEESLSAPELKVDKILHIMDMDANEFIFQRYHLKVEKEFLVIFLGKAHPVVFLKERLFSWKETKPKKRFSQYQYVKYKKGYKVGKETEVSFLTKEDAQEAVCDLIDLVEKLRGHKDMMDWELDRTGFGN